MNKLLFLLILMIPSVGTVMAQVGTDPYLVDPNGSPVMVPSRFSRSADFAGSQDESRSKYQIPGTMRGAERDLSGERLLSEDAMAYSSSVHLRDTTSVYVIDQEGNPVREMDQMSSDHMQNQRRNEIELFPSE